MHSYILSLFVLIHHATISLMAPVASPSIAAPIVPRQMQQNVTMFGTNPILNTHPFVIPAIIAANPNVVIYHIPRTRTTLYIQLTRSIPSAGMSSTLLLAQSYVEAHIDRSGDGPLSIRDDPFKFDSGVGVKLSIESAQGQHMTYGILRSTLKGIRDYLYAMHRYKGALFAIAEGDLGMVGSGVIEASSQ